jgi:hypothetical protein
MDFNNSNNNSFSTNPANFSSGNSFVNNPMDLRNMNNSSYSTNQNDSSDDYDMNTTNKKVSASFVIWQAKIFLIILSLIFIPFPYSLIPVVVFILL